MRVLKKPLTIITPPPTPPRIRGGAQADAPLRKQVCTAGEPQSPLLEFG